MFNEKTWRDGENLVQQHLTKNGYKILKTNFSCVGVEIDIASILPKNVQLKSLKAEFKEKLKNAESKHAKDVQKQIFKNMKKQVAPILVITEVKARSTGEFGSGAEAVSCAKQNNIMVGAKFFQKKFNLEHLQVRFDVASVDDGNLSYIENAFCDKNF